MHTPRKAADWAGCIFCLAWSVTVTAGSLHAMRSAPALALFMLPGLLHETIAAASFLIRRPLRAQSGGWVPRLAAYAGSFLVPVFCWYAGRSHAGWMASTGGDAGAKLGCLVWFAGTVLVLWSIVHLRHAFSFVPQARTLVHSGPYRVARHPVYAGYILQYAGIFAAHRTLPLSLALLAWLGLTITRVRHEERILAGALPGYEAYRQRTGMFWPAAASLRAFATGERAALQPLPEPGAAS